MWILCALASAFFLGIYDTFKKKATCTNGVMNILLYTTLLSTLFFVPMILSSAFGWGLGDGTVFEVGSGTLTDHLYVFAKALIVSVSWVSGLYGLQHLPITTAGTLKASRPVFVLIFSILFFGERLQLLQWIGVVISLVALWMLSRSSRKEGIRFAHNKWIWMMVISIFSGVASALLDKHILSWIQPMFVQSWCNFYIFLIIAITVLIQKKSGSRFYEHFIWNRYILYIALLITAADFLYFYTLSCEGSQLSVVSLLRRGSVIITFISGAIIFKERNLKEKALDLFILLIGISILVVGSGKSTEKQQNFNNIKQAYESYQETGYIDTTVLSVESIEAAIANKTNNEQLATAYYLRSKIMDSYSHDESLVELRKACLLAGNTKNYELITHCFLDYGIELNQMMWNASAFTCCSIANTAAENAGLKEERILALINMARAKLSPKDKTSADIDAASGYCSQAKALAEEMDDIDCLSKVIYATTSCHIALGEYEKALETAKQAIALMEKSYAEGIRKSEVSYYQLAQAYYYNSNADESLYYALKETENTDIINKAFANRLVADIYINLYGDVEKAAPYLAEYNEYIQIEDIQNINQKLFIDEVQLNQHIFDNTLKQWVVHMIVALFSIGICSVCFILYLQRKNRKEKNEQNAIIRKNEEVAQSLRAELVSNDPFITSIKKTPVFLKDNQWDHLMFITDKMYDNYCTDLKEIGLTNNNIRLAAATKLGFSTTECSILFGISPSSVTRAKHRLKTKLNE